jgi:hypothetical protein
MTTHANAGPNPTASSSLLTMVNSSQAPPGSWCARDPVEPPRPETNTTNPTVVDDDDPARECTPEERAHAHAVIGAFLELYRRNPDQSMLQQAFDQSRQRDTGGGEFMQPYMDMLRRLSMDRAACRIDPSIENLPVSDRPWLTDELPPEPTKKKKKKKKKKKQSSPFVSPDDHRDKSPDHQPPDNDDPGHASHDPKLPGGWAYEHPADANAKLHHHAAGKKKGRTNSLDARRAATAAVSRPSPNVTAEDPPEALIIDSVGLSTARLYIRAVKLWFSWVIQSGCSVVSTTDLDHSMALWMSEQASDEANPALGDHTLNGTRWIWPELAGSLPRASRSLLGWHKVWIGGEGQPQPYAILVVVMEAMKRGGRLGVESADALLLALDCYLRIGEWAALRAMDIVCTSNDDYAIRLGVPEREEKTKTGMRQGVRIDWPKTCRMIDQRLRDRKPDAKLFDVTPAVFRRIWYATCKELGVVLGPPHTIRHSGPSHDLFTAYRSLWQIQRRGRWSSEKSVLRYAKTHMLIESTAKLPGDLLARGNDILKTWQPRCTPARE